MKKELHDMGDQGGGTNLEKAFLYILETQDSWLPYTQSPHYIEVEMLNCVALAKLVLIS